MAGCQTHPKTARPQKNNVWNSASRENYDANTTRLGARVGEIRWTSHDLALIVVTLPIFTEKFQVIEQQILE